MPNITKDISRDSHNPFWIKKVQNEQVGGTIYWIMETEEHIRAGYFETLKEAYRYLDKVRSQALNDPSPSVHSLIGTLKVIANG